MSDTLLFIIGLVGMFVVISGAAYFLQSNPMKKNGFFTTPPTLSVKIVTFLLGLLFLAVFVLEVLTSTVLHLILPLLAAALLTYTFGAERLIQAWENRGKK